MLQSLVTEMVRRRLWPIPLVAVLIAIAGPLLFMKDASDAPAPRSLEPSIGQSSGDLPADADALLSDDERVERVRRPGQDPFDRPRAVEEAARKDDPATKGAAAKEAKGASEARAKVKAVVKALSGDGASSKAAPSQGVTSAPSGTKTSKAKKRRSTPKLSTGSRISLASVDVRYGATKDSKVLRTIPQRKVFQADGEAIAVFIRYSGKRSKALFAVAPGVDVSGSVNCEIVDGVCRYLAIPDGGWARLSYRRADGTKVSRRLDVSIQRIMAASKPELPAAKLEQGNCVLDKLLNLPAGSLALPLERCG